MVAYESIFILRPDLDDEAVGKTCDRIATLVADNDGSVIAMEKVGRRRLSYEVKGQMEGFYVILNYEGQATTTAELERTYKISDEFIRSLTVKREVPYKPAMIREPAKEAAAAAPGETAGEAAPAAAAGEAPAPAQASKPEAASAEPAPAEAAPVAPVAPKAEEAPAAESAPAGEGPKESETR